MKKTGIIFLTILIASAAVTGYFYRDRLLEFLPLNSEVDTALRATGTIEIQEVDISSRLTGYIADIPVEESDLVKEDQLLAVIDRPDLLAQLSRERASVERAKALLEDIQKGARKEEIAEIDARIKAALSRYGQAEKDYERYHRLYEDNVVSSKQMEEFRLSRNVALEEVKALREKRDFLLLGARNDQIKAQEEEIKRLEANVEITETEIKDTRITSPLSGVVLLKNYERGELASAGSILLTIGDYTDCWINIYVPSNLLGFVYPGQEASVSVDSWPGTSFTGKVSEIAERAEYTPRASITPEERANLVFRVRVSLDNREGIFKPGMPADVIIMKKGMK